MNLKNINHLFRAYFIENKKMLLICCVISFALVAWGFSTNTEPEIAPFLPWLILTWIAGTFFQSSLKRNNCTHFFNLPVTSLERFLYATTLIILLAILFQAFSIAGAYTGRYLIRPLLGYSMDFRFSVIGCIGLDKLYGVLLWAAALAALLFGSIYYKKNAFWKTLGTGLGFLMILAVYHLILLYFTFGNELFNDHNINLNYEFIGNYKEIVLSAITLFFLSLTYLRLKETEV
ncbi:MAG: hypothetical protein FWC10_06125 [Lentimicrobiaceae bacterium]|nr:hypothetical protein [Lentimicrobiaceae bacterium]